MYTAIRLKEFEKSTRKLAQSGASRKIRDEIERVIDILSAGDHLPLKYRDHKLTGTFEGYRECHIKDDLLLIYQIKQKELILILAEIGSHSYLFGQ